MSTTNTGHVRASRKSSLRYDLRRRVLVSNLSRSVTPTLPPSTQDANEASANPRKMLLPSKQAPTAPLDLLKDIPSDKKAKQQCTSPHLLTTRRTPEKRKFRIDPSVLSDRNPIVHTPVKAAAPPKRRVSEPIKDTMSLHLLREEYTPPTKKERLEHSFKSLAGRPNTTAADTVLINPSAPALSDKLGNYDIPARPVPLPRKLRATSRASSASSSNASDADPLYARIENCVTGSREDLVKYDLPREKFSEVKPILRNRPIVMDRRSRLIEECAQPNRRRNSLPINSNICLRPRFSSTSGECRARKSLLFSDSVGTPKTESGLTLRNIYAEHEDDHTTGETPLKDTINRLRHSPEEKFAPKIRNRNGIYFNNTVVVETAQLKKDETDRSYGFTCRMRPSLRALCESRSPAALLPNKAVQRNVDGRTAAPESNIDDRMVTCIPPTPPPRPPKKENTTPGKEIATQTSFVVHDADMCQKSSKKRRSSMEIFAEVSAKVKRHGSIMKRKLRRSLEITPVK